MPNRAHDSSAPVRTPTSTWADHIDRLIELDRVLPVSKSFPFGATTDIASERLLVNNSDSVKGAPTSSRTQELTVPRRCRLKARMLTGLHADWPTRPSFHSFEYTSATAGHWPFGSPARRRGPRHDVQTRGAVSGFFQLSSRYDYYVGD